MIEPRTDETFVELDKKFLIAACRGMEQNFKILVVLRHLRVAFKFFM